VHVIGVMEIASVLSPAPENVSPPNLKLSLHISLQITNFSMRRWKTLTRAQNVFVAMQCMAEHLMTRKCVLSVPVFIFYVFFVIACNALVTLLALSVVSYELMNL